MKIYAEHEIVAARGYCYEGDSGGYRTVCPFLRNNMRKHVNHGKKGISYTAYHERCVMFKEWLEGNSVAPQCCEACLKAQASYARMADLVKKATEEVQDDKANT